jgi:hypothetical protein
MGVTDTAPRYTREQVAAAQARYLERKREGQARSKLARQSPHVLRATGMRITRMSSDRMRALAGNRQSWQSLAWGYRDMIGELRFGLQFRARAISKTRFYVAELLDGDDDEPIAVELRNERDDDGEPTERAQRVTLSEDICLAAEQELKRLPLDAGMSFTGIWSENFDVAGDCWLYGREDPDTGEDVWEIRAFDAVEIQGDQVTIKDELDQPRRVDLSENSGEELYRLWIQHPRTPRLADSALNACMDSLEDITLAGREMRAASRSRIAANGIAFFPEGFLERQNVKDDDETTKEDAFVTDLSATFLAPISNEGDAGAVVPAVMFASLEDIEGFRFVRFDRETSPELIQRLDRALSRMAQSIDIPPEIITGMAEVNHWSAWQIDAATFTHYLEPSIRIMADSLTVAYLRHKLRTLGFPQEEIRRIRVWYNAGQITENPNRRQDALDAYDRVAIGSPALRDALGFNDQDAPTAEEILQIIAAKNGMDTALAAQILAWAAEQEGADLPPTQIAPAPQQRGLPAAPPAQPDDTGVGGTGAPDTAPTGITASATPPLPYVVDIELGRDLAEYERVLRDRVLLAADAAIERAIERASNRLRSKAQADQELVASLRPRPVREWAMVIGREQALGLGADVAFLLREAWDELRDKFTQWTGEAISKIAERVGKLLNVDTSSTSARARISRALAARVGPAWEKFADQLNEHVARRLFGETGPVAADGEEPTVTLPPGLVRAVLADIGGLPDTAAGIGPRGTIPSGEALTGLTDGTIVAGELGAHDVHLLGREWRYNPLLERNTFLPHHDLDGVRFTSWTDSKLATDIAHAWIGKHYRPGDHAGCLCDSVPAYLVRTGTTRLTPLAPGTPAEVDSAMSTQLRERLAQPSQAMAELIVLAESDDRAGRRGTSAQVARDQWLEIQAMQRQYLNGATA